MDLELSNKALQSDLNNVELEYTQLDKGNLGRRYTLNTVTLEPLAFISYIYKSKKARDEDYKIVNNFISIPRL